MKKFLATLALALPFGLLAQNDLVELVRSDVRTEMRAIVTLNMGLTEAESEKFWPLYDAYEQDRKGLWDRKIALLKEYAEVYEGMVVGENSRSDEMVVNAVRAKEKTNIRTHSHDDAVKLAAPIVHTLETAIEWIADDELVEVTPKAIRIRKRHLGLEDRRRAHRKGQ